MWHKKPALVEFHNLHYTSQLICKVNWGHILHHCHTVPSPKFRKKKTFLSGGDQNPIPKISPHAVNSECPRMSHWRNDLAKSLTCPLYSKCGFIYQRKVDFDWTRPLISVLFYCIQYGMLICNFHFNRPTNKVSCSCIIQYTLVCSC